jgi:hypothetical protein
MNPDLLTQMLRDIFEKNTMNDNPFSTVTECEINFIETKQFNNKMIVNVSFIGNKNFYLMVLSNEDLENLPRDLKGIK